MNAELRDELRRWARQRLEVGERVVSATQSQQARAERPAARTAPSGAAPPTMPSKSTAAFAPPSGVLFEQPSGDRLAPAPAARFAPDATQGSPRSAPATSATPATPATPVTPATPATMTTPADDSMARVAAEVSVCTRCRLSQTRNKAVPGVGPDNAGLVLIGEGPGAEEDLRGEPFVGAAGQLLNKILAAVQFRREDVFITNIVKCRPPNNRDPMPDEVAACEPYLKRQLALLKPHVICSLGRHAGSWLNGAPEPMGSLRTGERHYAGIRVFPTYHPAALLRNPQWKRPVWEDIQKVRQEYDRLSAAE